MSNKEDSIKNKMEKAIALMKEVDTLIANTFYTTAVSRLYYSCFHVTKALLLTKDLIPKTHRGVDILLHEHFVKVNEFDTEQASFFGKLMQERIDDDYSDYMVLEIEEIIAYIKPAKSYLEYVLSLINSKILR